MGNLMVACIGLSRIRQAALTDKKLEHLPIISAPKNPFNPSLLLFLIEATFDLKTIAYGYFDLNVTNVLMVRWDVNTNEQADKYTYKAETE